MATFNFNKANLAAAQIPASITSSQTSITVDSGDAATFPTPPFFATIMPAGGVPNTLNSEIVQVTAVNTSTGVLTITRAQRGSTAKQQDEGAVIMNGVYIEDLAQAQAVGLAFFSATNVSVSSSYSYWNIDNAMLPTAPTDGMSIRVVFGANTSGPAAQLRLNGGTYHNVYAGVGLTATASNVNTTTPFNPKSGIIYELVYYNNAWYAMNVPANNSITSDNVDWTTFGVIVVDTGTVGSYFSGQSSATFNIPQNGVYILFDCFSGTFQRVANAVNQLSVKIDGNQVIRYDYMSIPQDEYWGSTRRPITGTQRKLTLTAGNHTISTSGNLYFDANYYPPYHDVFLLRVG